MKATDAQLRHIAALALHVLREIATDPKAKPHDRKEAAHLYRAYTGRKVDARS